jgi:hypothetical protein
MGYYQLSIAPHFKKCGVLQLFNKSQDETLGILEDEVHTYLRQSAKAASKRYCVFVQLLSELVVIRKRLNRVKDRWRQLNTDSTNGIGSVLSANVRTRFFSHDGYCSGNVEGVMEQAGQRYPAHG